MRAADGPRHLEEPGAPTALVGQLPAIVWEAEGLHDPTTFVSPRAREVLGHDPERWCATPGFWQAHLHPDDQPRIVAALRRAIAAGPGTTRLRYRFRAADGGYHWFQDTIAVRVADGGAPHLAGLMLDVTEEQGELDSIVAGTVAQAMESRTGGMHAAIVDNLQDGVYYVDTDRRINYWNRGAERLTGYRAEEVVGHRCFDNILCHVDAEGTNLCKRRCPLAATMVDGVTRNIVVWLKHADGSRRPVQTRTAPIRTPDGRIVGGVEIFNDATGLIDAQDAADAARRDALTDALTGLPNRRLLDAVMASRQEDFDRFGKPYALLIADVDHFKAVNDRYGHDAGDAVLRVIAMTLKGGVRGGDALVRWGGEEFAIAAAVKGASGVDTLAQRLLMLTRHARVELEGHPVPVRISIGAALALPGERPESLFHRADHALLAAKEGGRDRYVLATAALR